VPHYLLISNYSSGPAFEKSRAKDVKTGTIPIMSKHLQKQSKPDHELAMTEGVPS